MNCCLLLSSLPSTNKIDGGKWIPTNTRIARWFDWSDAWNVGWELGLEDAWNEWSITKSENDSKGMSSVNVCSHCSGDHTAEMRMNVRVGKKDVENHWTWTCHIGSGWAQLNLTTFSIPMCSKLCNKKIHVPAPWLGSCYMPIIN